LEIVCKDACEKSGLIKPNEKADEKRCLATIMLLPQKKTYRNKYTIGIGR